MSKNSLGPDEQAKLREFMASNDMVKKLSAQGNPIAVLMKRLEGLNGYLQHLEQGLMSLANNMQMLGVESNIARLSSAMIYKILIEKNIMTEDEIKAMYEVEVSAKIREYLENLQKQAQAEEQGSASPEAVPEPVPEATEKAEEVPTSDVILPSEANAPVVFSSEGAVDLTK